MSLSTLNIFLPSLRVFVYLWVSWSTLNIVLPSLRVFVRLCSSLSTSNVFLPSLGVFVCLCASLRVFVCLCVVWVSLRYLDRPPSKGFHEVFMDFLRRHSFLTKVLDNCCDSKFIHFVNVSQPPLLKVLYISNQA